MTSASDFEDYQYMMDLEKLATSSVSDSISLTETMSPFVNDGDKEPVWDGHIYIYADKYKRKDNIKKVPVQVKGKKEKNLEAETIRYSLGIPYLKNYLDDGGVFFFVVYISPDGRKKQIYYASLLPIKLRIILSDLKEGQKTRTFELKKFPEDNIKKTMILLNFYENMQKQTSFRHAKLLSQEELFQQGRLESISFTVPSYGKRPDDIRDLIFDVDDLYMYANIKGASIPQPLEEIPVALHIAEDMHIAVSVNGINHYDGFRRIKSKGKIELQIGKSVTIIKAEADNNLKITFKPTTILEDALIDIPFIIEIIKYHQIEIGGIAINLDGVESIYSQEKVEGLSSNLDYYRKISEVFDALRLDRNCDVAKFTIEDHKNTVRLYTALIEKKPVSRLRKDIPYVALLDYVNTKLLLIFKATENPGTYTITDFFTDNSYELYRIGEDGKRFPTSKYMNLTADDFLKIGNVDYTDIIASFMNYIDEPYCTEEATLLLLQIILAYDDSRGKRRDLLDHAEEIAKWLIERESIDSNPAISELNFLQIQMRKRSLTDDEEAELVKIAECVCKGDKKQEYSLKVGANLLLDNQRTAKFYFERLGKEDQEQFRKYPIWKFCKFEGSNVAST